MMSKIYLNLLFFCCCILNAANIRQSYSDDKETESLQHISAGLPSPSDILLKRSGFALGYNKKFRQAIWVCYILTAEKLEMPKVPRARFRIDPAITSRPVSPKDYSRSGYDRGHLVPAADMTYSIETMNHSFYMSNISPQIPGCNRGIWKRLEQQVRRWVRREKKLFIISGPIFQNTQKKVGKNDIPVPTAFFKIILDMTPPLKMIAFIVPNQTSRRRIKSFAVSVDDVERITGYDFFNTLDDEIENKLEKEKNFSAWQ